MPAQPHFAVSMVVLMGRESGVAGGGMRPWAVIAGCFLATCGWLLLAGVWLAQELNDSAPPVNAWRDSIVPVVAATGVLLFPRTRWAGAGLMFGLAVTTLVWAVPAVALAAITGAGR